MKAASFDYLRPKDVPEAIKALAGAAGEAKVFAGGQSLGPMLNLRLARPKLLVDVGRMESMRAIEDGGTFWRIGASVTHSTIEDARLPGGEALSAVAGNIAYRAIRNRGTIGGSLAHADPAADWPLALAALGATLNLAGPAGDCSVPAEGFMIGAFATALAEDELIVSIEVPKPSTSVRWGYYKFCRKTGEFPEASAALLLDRERGVARLWTGALNGAPQPLATLAGEVALRGALAATPEAAGRALERAAPELDPIAHKLHLTAVRRAIQKAFE